MPVDWQRSTLAHLCSAYPFHADAGFGERGALLGTNVTGGLSGFYFDPFEFYNAGRLSNPNMIVMGSVGFGKSATVKAFVRRLRAVYGPDRYLAVIDPKGEYGALAADLGLATVKLYPGGADRVNPMDPGGGDSDSSVIARQTLAAQLVCGVLGRDLSPLEDAVLGWAIEQRCRSGVAFTLRNLSSEILDPPDELVRLSRHTPLELARATAPVTFALDKLCSRTLRGMFDTATTVSVDWDNGPGVVLDLSAVYSNSDALPPGDGRCHALVDGRVARPSAPPIDPSCRRGLGRCQARCGLLPIVTQTVTHLRRGDCSGVSPTVRSHRAGRRRHGLGQDRGRPAE